MRPISAEIPTPSLVLDRDALDRNIARAADLAERAGLALRPHAKAHKSCRIAARQVQAGAVGICVASVREAEMLAAPEIRSILLTSPVTNSEKIARFMALGRKQVALLAVVDTHEGASRLAAAAQRAGATIGLVVDVDIGMNRTGAAIGQVPALVAHIKSLEGGASFAGLQGYSGLVQHIADWSERASVYRTQTGLLRALSVECGTRVTGGGTGTLWIDAADAIINEAQPGSYVFMDGQYGEVRLAPDPAEATFEQALWVRTAVISRPIAAQATLDAGTKSIAPDQPRQQVWRTASASVEQARALSFHFFGDEFGRLTGTPLPAVGDWVDIVPAHCDPTVNLHDRYYVVSGGELVDVWPIDGRGLALSSAESARQHTDERQASA